MRNNKTGLMHDPAKGVYLFRHTPSKLKFAIEGNRPQAYLKDCVAFPDREDVDEIHRTNYQVVLEDFKVVTRYQFDEFILYPECPGQMEKLLTFIREQTCFEEPQIVISESMFKHIYGMDRT